MKTREQIIKSNRYEEKYTHILTNKDTKPIDDIIKEMRNTYDKDEMIEKAKQLICAEQRTERALNNEKAITFVIETIKNTFLKGDIFKATDIFCILPSNFYSYKSHIVQTAVYIALDRLCNDTYLIRKTMRSGKRTPLGRISYTQVYQIA